jgi:zinc transport system permease protein
MGDVSALWDLIPRVLPFECLKPRFMQHALVGLLLVAPMAAAMGVQVVNFRMAFFADAISHSAFAGVAFGLLFAVSPQWTMPVFAVLVGLSVMVLHRRSTLSSDTAVGVVFSAVLAFGLAIVSRDRRVARDLQQFLYGDILTVTGGELAVLTALFLAVAAFQTFGFNRMLYVGVHPGLAAAHRVRVAFYQYAFAGLLSLVVILSVWAVGVLLVTALLIVPAAAARHFARSSGGMFRWAVLIGATSAVTGLIVSAQDWARTATGATVVLVSFAWFLASCGIVWLRNRTP